MARPGNAADPRSANRHPTAEWLEVPDVPFDWAAAGRALPGHREWHPDVVTWFGVVAAMPHAATWRDSDWLSVYDLAAIKQTFYQGAASAGLVTEMRKREDDIGVTSEARTKLRVRYVTPDTHTPAATEQPPASDPAAGAGSVTPIASARDRLRRATG